MFLRDSLNRGCLNHMLCSVLQQNFFLGGKGPSETLIMAHVALPHAEKQSAANSAGSLRIFFSTTKCFPESIAIAGENESWLYREGVP